MEKRLSFVFVALALAAGLSAQAYKVVVPQLSPAATETYTKAIQAIADAEGKTISVQVLPFARAVYLIEMKQADIESSIVQIPDQKKWANQKFDYSTAELLKIVWVAYSTKGKAVNVGELKKGNVQGLKIETDGAHLGHFPFAAAASTSIDASLKKVDSGAIDVYLFTQGSGDAALKRLGLKNIARQYYDTLSGVFMLQKGARGGPIDQMITSGLAKIKANGKYQEIVGPYAAGASPYVEWQP